MNMRCDARHRSGLRCDRSAGHDGAHEAANCDTHSWASWTDAAFDAVPPPAVANPTTVAHVADCAGDDFIFYAASDDEQPCKACGDMAEGTHRGEHWCLWCINDPEGRGRWTMLNDQASRLVHEAAQDKRVGARLTPREALEQAAGLIEAMALVLRGESLIDPAAAVGVESFIRRLHQVAEEVPHA